MTPTSLLYIVGPGSNWGDKELRYSLRSVAAYCPVEQIVICGHKPSWVVNVEHIPVEDAYGGRKLANSVHKLTTAIARGVLPSEFVLMNDDFLFLAPCEDLPLRHKGPLLNSIRSHPTTRGYYSDALHWMYADLVSRGHLDPLDYGTHHPFPVVTRLAWQVLDTFQAVSDRGYLFRSAYSNLTQDEGVLSKDCKVKGNGWVEPSDTAGFLSTDDVVVHNPRFREFLNLKFPTPCIYER